MMAEKHWENSRLTTGLTHTHVHALTERDSKLQPDFFGKMQIQEIFDFLNLY